MPWIVETWRRWRAMLRRDALEHGLEEEIQFHLEQQIQKHRRAGMRADEARRRALLRFGGMEATKERVRDELRPALLEDSLRDLRHGARALRRAPVFTAVASLTLALGIGAAVAVFSVVHGVLLKPLAYPGADALVGLWHAAPGANLPDDVPMAATQFFTYRDHNRTFEAIGLWSSGTATVTDAAAPEEVRSLSVTHGTLQALGVPPLAGRWFTRADDAPEAVETVILMHGYWQRRFGGDRALIGRTIIVDARPRQVIGVMPERFRFLNADAEMLLPSRFDPAGLFLRKPTHHGLARLRPGVTLAQANADVARMIPIWLRAWSTAPGIDPAIFTNARFTPALRPLKADVVGDVGGVLWVLMGTVGIVLLIACANVANLLLVRADDRRHELAIRAALGARAGRLARELLLESVVLAFAGGAIGLAFAAAGLRLLAALAPAGLPRIEEVAIDPAVWLFALIVSLLSGLLFGLVPVLRHAGPQIGMLLRGAGRAAGPDPARRRARGLLVIAQVALAMVLLVTSGLMVRTFQALRAVPPGFTQPEQVALLRVSIPAARADGPDRLLALQQALRDRLAALPGVASVALTSRAPMEAGAIDNLLFVEHRTPPAGDVAPSRRFLFVSPALFRTLGVPIVAGRDLTWDDLDRRRPVVIISENLARELWRTPSAALGQRIRANATDPWRAIVGVAGDVHDAGLHERAPATVYWPLLMERFWGQPLLQQRAVTVAVRSPRAGSESFAAELRDAVGGVDPNLLLAQPRTLGDLYARALARTSFALVMLALAAATALLLGSVGIYGAIAYTVAQRTREIGIRVALGAGRAGVIWLFVRQGLLLAGLGLLLGAAAAAGLTRVMASLLFGIGPRDPLTYAAVAALLVSAAALASFMPARRATRVDPVTALRRP